MGNKLRVIIMVLAVPVLGYGCAAASQDQLDSQLRDSIREEYSSVTDEQLSTITLSDLCAEPEFSGEDVCDTGETVTLIREASVASGLVGVALLVLIWVTGKAAANRRRLLVTLFRPGLYLTAIVLVGLVVSYAGIAMGATYYTESLFFGRVHFGVIAVIGLGAIGGVGAIATNAFRFLKEAETTAIGVAVSDDDAPELWSAVRSLAQEMEALVPENIVVGVEPNFYVTEADVNCLSGTVSGRTLYCSTSLMRILTETETKAILAHELAHFKGEDTEYSQKFFPIYSGAQNSLNALAETGGEGWGSLALLPAIAVFDHFLTSFSVAERKISRDREIVADSEASSLFGGEQLGVALIKVHAFSGTWQPIQEQAVRLLQNGQMLQNMGTYFAQSVRQAAELDVLSDLDDSTMSHPTDTHPPLETRLSALDVSVADVGTQALMLEPNDAAISMVSDSDEVEESVSDAYQIVLAKGLGIDVEGS